MVIITMMSTRNMHKCLCLNLLYYHYSLTLALCFSLSLHCLLHQSIESYNDSLLIFMTILKLVGPPDCGVPVFNHILDDMVNNSLSVIVFLGISGIG